METCNNIREYSVDELSDFLEGKGISETVLSILRENRVVGDVFLDLTESDLREIVKPLGERKALLKLINHYKPAEAASTGIAMSLVSAMRYT